MNVGEAYIIPSDLKIPFEDFNKLSDEEWLARYSTTKLELFAEYPLYFYARKTTKKDGQPRSLMINSRNGMQIAVYDALLWGPVAWSTKTTPKRWIPITKSSESVKPLKPEGSSQQLLFAAEEQTYAISVRWQTTANFIVPDLKNFSDYDPKFVVGTPGFTNRNYKFKGKSKPKLGAGFIVSVDKVNYNEREYDNHHHKNLADLQNKPGDFYLPVNYLNPYPLWDGNKILGITINYPVTGFLDSLGLLDRLPTTYYPDYSINK